MSSSIEILILLPLLAAALNRDNLAAAGSTLGLGAVLLADGVAAPIAASIHHLQSEYDSAYRTYLERSRLKLELAAQRKEDFAEEQLEALALSELAQVGNRPDATLELLLRGLKHLEESNSPLSPPPSDLTGAIAQLRTDLSSGAVTTEMLERYRALAAKANLLVAQLPVTDTLESAVKHLRVQVGSALLTRQLREELASQLDLLVGLQGQPEMARQGLAVLQRRVERELAAAALEHAQWNEQMARLGAALTTLALPEVDETIRSKANAIRAQLAALLAEHRETDIAALRELAHSADDLYATWLDQRRHALQRAIVEDNIRDVLQGMGYRVSTVTASGQMALAVSLDDSVGVEIAVDDSGRLHSEMVAYQPDQLPAAAAREEEVCSLMDKVFERLRERKLEVREKMRRPLRHPLELKLAQRPQRASADLKAQEPLRRTLDEG